LSDEFLQAKHELGSVKLELDLLKVKAEQDSQSGHPQMSFEGLQQQVQENIDLRKTLSRLEEMFQMIAIDNPAVLAQYSGIEAKNPLEELRQANETLIRETKEQRRELENRENEMIVL
jgi:predicted nucleotidyltransferase